MVAALLEVADDFHDIREGFFRVKVEHLVGPYWFGLDHDLIDVTAANLLFF